MKRIKKGDRVVLYSKDGTAFALGSFIEFEKDEAVIDIGGGSRARWAKDRVGRAPQLKAI